MLFFTSLFLDVGSLEVFANDTIPWQETSTPWKDENTKTETSIAQWLEFIIRALYLVMRPLLAIAWAAMDNSLVYGGILILNQYFGDFGISWDHLQTLV
jgi:hypothetical protein